MTNKQKNNIKIVGGAIVMSSLTGQAVMAQEATGGGVQEVADTVDSIGGIAGAAVSIVVLAMGVRLAIKQVNRVMTKG